MRLVVNLQGIVISIKLGLILILCFYRCLKRVSTLHNFGLCVNVEDYQM